MLATLTIVTLLVNYLSFFAPEVVQAQASDPTIEQQINVIDQQYSRIWYSPSWTRRQPVTLVNETSALTNYQVKLAITYDADMQADFDDLRFTNALGTLLDYWLERKTDSTSATVWVEVDSLPANATTAIYMYYGNASATSASSGSNTFEMFDDFNDGNYTGWTVSSGTWTVNSGALETSSTGHLYISYDSFTSSDYIVETLMRITTSISGDQQAWVLGRFSTTGYGYGYRGADATTRWELWQGVSLELSQHDPQTMTQNTWFKQALLMKGIISKAKSWTASGSDPGWQIIAANAAYTSGKVGFKSSWAAATVQYDDVFVRKFAVTEPGSSFGTEETFSGFTSFAPTDNSLGIFTFNPDKYNGETVYFEAIHSVDETTWTRSRSSSLSMPSTAKDFTVRLRIGDNASQLPAVELRNITDPSSTSTITYGAASDTKAYLRAARLIIVQSDATMISDTMTMIEVGDDQTIVSAADTTLTNKKIYRWDATKYSGTVNVYFETGMRAGWQNRRKLTFDNSASSEALTDFPVLVKLTSPGRIDYTKTQDAGQDIRFVDADGVTELPYEIEKWDEAGTSSIWVKVPDIPSGSTTDYIWMYYNNTEAQDTQDRTSVWNSGYKLVHHFNESGTTDMDDSTSNSNMGTKKAVSEPNTVSTGQIDGAQDFDGTNDKVISSVAEHSPYTLEAWVKLDAIANKNITVRAYTDPTSTWSHQLRTSTDKFEHKLWDGASQSVTGTTTVSTGTWYYVAGTAVNSGSMYLYVNGASEGTPDTVGTIWTGGSHYHTGSNSGDSKGYFDGVIDEVRVSNVVRSGEWIEASSKSMNDTLISSFGTEESVGTGYVSLYPNGTSCASQVTGSEVSVASSSWSRARSSDIRANLTSGTDYMVCAENAILADAKIIVEQTAAGGLTDMELYHEYVNSKKSLSQTGSTAYARLAIAGGAAVSGSTVSTTSTSYSRQRSSSITPSTNTYDTEISLDNSTYTQQDYDNQYTSGNWVGGTFTYLFEATLRTPSANNEDISNSWLIIQVSSLQVPENLLLFVPLALFLPAAIKRFRLKAIRTGLFSP